jgi:methionyl-tRNA formyltransferase
MNPWPGAYGFINGERFKILNAIPVYPVRKDNSNGVNGDGEAGLIEKVDRDELHVYTGKGKISIIEIQPSGKPAMAVKAFLQGRKLEEGMRFSLEDLRSIK